MITAIIAMESEAEILLKNATVTAEKTLLGKKTYEGEFHGKKFALVICGVGKVNAAVGAAAGITAYRPSSVLNFGVAGGLNESAKLCEVYAINKAVQFDFDLTQLNGGKIGTLDEYTENYLPLSPLPPVLSAAFPVRALATADRFNDSAADYALLGRLRNRTDGKKRRRSRIFFQSDFRRRGQRQHHAAVPAKPRGGAFQP